MKLKKLLTKILFWLAMEVFLGFVGLDSLADYGEFIDTKKSMQLIY